MLSPSDANSKKQLKNEVDIIKKVVGVSLGASSRDHSVIVDVLGEKIEATRYGCDGDMELLKKRLIEADQDPDVAAIGLGGVAIGFRAADKYYVFPEIERIVRVVKNTPVLDGGGLKQAVEGRVVPFMENDLDLPIKGVKALQMCSIDRWGLAVAFEEAGAINTFGDLLYALDLKIMIRSMKNMRRLVKAILPVARLLPFSVVYDSAADAHSASKRDEYTDKLYADNKYLVGDYKYVIKYLPEDISGKIVVTNTTTLDDIELLRSHGAEMVIASTPAFNGRTFGTNILEALLVAYKGAREPLSFDEYFELIAEAKFYPAVYDFREKSADSSL